MPRPPVIVVPGGGGIKRDNKGANVSAYMDFTPIYEANVEEERQRIFAELAKQLRPDLFESKDIAPQVASAESLQPVAQEGQAAEPQAGQQPGAGNFLLNLPGGTAAPRVDPALLAKSPQMRQLASQAMVTNLFPSKTEQLITQAMQSGDMSRAQQLINMKKGPAKESGSVTPFKTFYAGEKEKDPSATNAEIYERYQKSQAALLRERIPGFTPGSSPDYSFDRRTGQWVKSGTPTGITANDIKETFGNYAWFKTQGAQRLIRRTESIVAPGGAVDEAIRFAELVDNPAGTPINKLTGKAKVLFGDSRRQLLNLVTNVSAEEQQQIFGAMGGGERFLELAQSLTNPDLSVEQYVNAAKEIKYLIYTRQVANVRGTPEEAKWEKLGSKFRAERPFAEQETPGAPTTQKDDMSQFWK